MRHQGATWMSRGQMCLEFGMSSCIYARMICRTNRRLQSRIRCALRRREVSQSLGHLTPRSVVLVEVPCATMLSKLFEIVLRYTKWCRGPISSRGGRSGTRATSSATSGSTRGKRGRRGGCESGFSGTRGGRHGGRGGRKVIKECLSRDGHRS